jgi:hypothetical protein
MLELRSKKVPVRYLHFKTTVFLFCACFCFFGLTTQVHAATDCTATATTGVPQSECQALIDLYTDTTGTGWTTSTNWNTASNVGTWYGVTVSGGHVTVLDFPSGSGNHLVGTLPASLGNLTYLTNLTLGGGNTGLTGSLPSSIGDLTNLTVLSIYNNGTGLTGNVSWLGNLTKLVTVFLHGNGLTGTIPSLSNLTSLVTLYLSSNQLTGTIPSGMPSTLRNLYLPSNQLVGPIPSDLASIPLTLFSIAYNHFVFSDIEPGYSSYHSYGTFTYSPQLNVDTTQTLSFQNGGVMTITPSVAANPSGNDNYQWYNNGSPISGATSRVFTKTSQDSDTGAYTYRVTNSVVTGLTLQSNTLNVNIAPVVPGPNLVFYMLNNASSTWIRGSISSTKDIAQNYITFSPTNNTNFNFGNTYIISSSTSNTVASYENGTALINGGDDVAPINTVNAGYIGGDHGLFSPVITATSDKTTSDIGSVWQDSGAHQYVLANVSGSSPETLTFYSVPAGSPWQYRTSVSGTTLTWVSGGVNESTITITSQVGAEQFPTVENVVNQVLVNGTTPVTTGASGYANYVDMSESYDLIDPSTINTTNNPFVWNSASGVWIHITNVYRATAGTTVVHSTYTVERPMNLGYFGIIQVGELAPAAYSDQYWYIPKTKPLSGYDFTTPQLLDSFPSSDLIFNTPNIANIADPPDRQITFYKAPADSTYDIGFAFGYSPYGSTAASNRNCATYLNGCWRIVHTSKKTYPVMDGGLGVINGASYDAYAYRQFIDPSQYDINKSVYWNNLNGHELVYADYWRSATNDTTTLPATYDGWNVSVIDSQNIQTPVSSVSSNGVLTLSTTGSNTSGWAELELSAPPSQTTSVTEGSGGTPIVNPVPSIFHAPSASTATTSALVATTSVSIATSTLSVASSTQFTFTRTLWFGMTGNQVKELQSFLASDPVLYPEGKVTGYFGMLTLRAVERFQTKYGIAMYWSPGYGLFGPRTRGVLNQLIKDGLAL